MHRDPAQLARPFDLLVIGGGIYGAWAAREGARRGLSVALVERSDWAAGTSSASSKLVHGGLRYLEQGHVRLVRRGLRERALLRRMAPHRVRPLRFLLPLYRGDRRGRGTLRAGLWLYDRLAGAEPPFQPSSWRPADRVRAEFPFLRADGLLGGFVFDDAVTDDARLTLEVVDAAVAAGAVAVNRARVTALLRAGGRVAGAEVRDEETGTVHRVAARTTLVCAGAWAGEIPGSGPATVRRTKGVHLVMPPLPGGEALLVPVPHDGRIIFLVPWHGRTLLGTTDTPWDGPPEDAGVEAGDVAYLLAAAARVLARPWTDADVIAGFAGLRALADPRSRAPSDLSREWALLAPSPGLLVSVGGKLTSARADAAVAVDRLRAAAPADDGPLPWTPPPGARWGAERLARAATLGLDEETARTALSHHGTRVDRVLDRVAAWPDLARRIVPDAPFCMAQAVHAVEEEMARSVQDVLRRRLPLLLVSRVPEAVRREVAAVCGVPA